MKLIIDIPDNEIPTKQDLLSIDLCFFNGKVSQCDYPFMELPKGHGRLIDADALPLNAIDDANYGSNYIRIAPTIIEADKENEE